MSCAHPYRFLVISMLFLFTVSITLAQDTAEIAGVWRTEGYAWVFDITPAW